MSSTATILLVFGVVLGVVFALPFLFAARGMDAARTALLSNAADGEAESLGYERVEEGLWRWLVPHPDWKAGADWEPTVGCVYWEGPDAVVLVDSRLQTRPNSLLARRCP